MGTISLLKMSFSEHFFSFFDDVLLNFHFFNVKSSSVIIRIELTCQNC